MDIKYTHIVSGYPRAGTSMVMEALELGGLKLAHTNFRQEADQRYEIPGTLQDKTNFPKQYWGRAIKVLFPPAGWVLDLCPQDYPLTNRYFIICMKRPFLEVKESYRKAVLDKEGKHLDWEVKDEKTHDAQFDKAVELLECRNDSDVVVWDYHDVITDPVKHFKQVPGLTYWAAASRVPDEDKRHELGGIIFPFKRPA